MSFTRRGLLASVILPAAATRLPASAAFEPSTEGEIGDRVDPWIELDRARYRHNSAAISQRAQGRPVIAVLKNNAYGVGVREVASILDDAPAIGGFAVVQAEDALALRQSGIRKPILLMARHANSEGEALARADVTLSAFADDDPERLARLSERLGRPVKVQLYIDTGLGRMGRWHGRLLPWLEALAGSVEVEGALTMLTSDEAFVAEQVERFARVRTVLVQRGVGPGLFHAASSAPLLHHPESLFDAVRPGILLHGSLPGGGPEEAALIDVSVAFRLRARVVRLERLPAGSTIGFSRFYPIERPTWIATVPTGWGDGYPSAAENGAVVVAGEGEGKRTFEVVNVNSNHTNLLVGDEKVVELGDVVTLFGFGDPAVTPEGLAARIGGHNYRQIELKSYIPRFIV